VEKGLHRVRLADGRRIPVDGQWISTAISGAAGNEEPGIEGISS